MDKNNANAHSESSGETAVSALQGWVQITGRTPNRRRVHTCVALHDVENGVRKILLQTPLHHRKLGYSAVMHELVASPMIRLTELRRTEQDIP